ncbi:MAG: helix-turn-helix transcriptional regulator [Erysipelotrichaceae bacterium]|nr:helix-turn-helix transcriptional regulator [Erysipelotrichaceae bacterium]
MSFAEKLKQARKEKQLSQEELAYMLDVSRQAVSKWELGEGYPEVEKLIMLARKLNVSLDYLLDIDVKEKQMSISKAILITSPHENVLARCVSIVSSKKMSGGKLAPAYALFGVYEGKDSTIFLGWYANKEKITQEIMNIHNAILQGCGEYTLQYSVKTTRKWLKVQMVDE